MRWDLCTLAAIIGVLALGGCDTGAREVELSPQRNYSADINAALNHGPTTGKPGMVSTGEPLGAMPWEIGNSRE
jgi:tRNA G37 N-methylase TrmD